MKNKNESILDFIQQNPLVSSKEIHDGISTEIGYAIVKRILSKLIVQDFKTTEGKGKGTRYSISTSCNLRKL